VTKKLNRAGRPTEKELELRKEKILKTAMRIFIRDGYAAASISDIARKSGVATRTIYQHFGDKQKLFETLVMSRALHLDLPSATIRADKSLKENVLHVAECIYGFGVGAGEAGIRRLLIGESTRFPALSRNSYKLVYDRVHEIVQAAFDDLVEQGAIDDSNTDAAASMFIDLIIGAGATYTLVGWEPPHTGELDDKVDIFVNGRWGKLNAASS
jgi:TetR/AcrR family transcriptional repressor of mexJK operon